MKLLGEPTPEPYDCPGAIAPPTPPNGETTTISTTAAPPNGPPSGPPNNWSRDCEKPIESTCINYPGAKFPSTDIR